MRKKYILDDLAQHSHNLFFSSANKGLSGRSFGGNCLLISKHCSSSSQIVHDDDHILAVKTILNGAPLLIIGVYLTCYHDKQSTTDFVDQLNILSCILKSNAGDFEPIIIGDFQTFPADIYDTMQRMNLKRNPLSQHLKNFLRGNNMKLYDVTDGTGPTVTYRHATLPNSSYIDHIAVQLETSLKFQECVVHPPEASNCSDHCPVSAVLQISETNSFEDVVEELLPRKLQKWVWNDASFIEKYQSLLDEALSDINTVPDAHEELNVIKNMETLVNAAFSAAEMVFPESRKKYSKSWWTPELTQEKQRLSTHFNIWRDNNFPKDGGVIHSRYLLARKAFRKMVKKAQNDETRKKYLLIDKLKNTEAQKFWSKMKNIRKTESKRLYTINGKQTGPEIANEFADHFSTLLNQPRVKTNIPAYNIYRTDNNTPVTFSSNDLAKAIRALKLGKSTDPFQVGSEHIIFADNIHLLTWLCDFFNSIFKNGQTPPCLSTSKMIPFVKSLKKSLKLAGNYRGISIIPILTKLLEYLILHKYPEIMKNHHLQFGFTSNSSTLHAEFVINETIKHYNKKKSGVYMCSLDAEKAFDSCNWDALFKKLVEEKNIPPPVVQVISSLYRNGTAQVHYENHISEEFKISQGVRQGSILSPYLYNIYTELLLSSLEQESVVGTTLHGVYTGIVMYADDIILLSPTISGLQLLADKCVKYCNNLGVAINAAKTEFLSSGTSNPADFLLMDYSRIYPGNTLKHLGFLWNIGNKRSKIADIDHENISERINKFWTVIHGLLKAGICSCAPYTRIALFRSIAIPTITYGLELCKLGITIKNKLDCECRRALKALFNVSRYSRNFLNKLFYINSISNTIHKNKINLCSRLLKNTTTRTLLLHMLAGNDNFVDDLKQDGVDVLELIMSGRQPDVQEEDALPGGVRVVLETCVKNWEVSEARHIFWGIMEEHIPVNENQ